MIIKDKYREFKNFFRNIWLFRKQLTRFQWWDYSFTLDMLSKSLEIMANNLETKGIEVDTPRMKKVAKIRRVIELIGNREGIEHIEMAEKELGSLYISKPEFEKIEENPTYYTMKYNETEEQKEHNRKVYDRARQLEEQEWNEIWDILKGQDIKKYKPKKQDWDDFFDGSGMNTWWD